MNVPMLTTDYLDRGTDLYDDVTAVVRDDGTEYTYEEFGDRVNKLSNALLDMGLERGDRVALVANNTHYFLETQFATQQLGMVFVPINYRLVASDYEYILNDCEAQAVVADYEYASEVDQVRDSVPTEHWVGYDTDHIDGDWVDYTDLVTDAPARPPERPNIAEDDDATINYTSGTTGDPKGVVRTHRTEHFHAMVLSQHHELREDDTYLWTLPMFHVNGWGHTYALTGLGATHVCSRGFDAAETFERIREYDVSFLCGAPTVLNLLVDFHERETPETTGDREVRLATAGSAPPQATIKTVEESFGWRLIHLYGMTETAPIVTTSNSPRRLEEGDPYDIKPRQGFATLNTEVRVVDENGEDVPRDDATMGEVVVRGNQVMDRYLNKPEITEKAFTDRAEGYFHTGDLGTWDEHGMVQIQDRKKDIIITGGENVSSIEVQDTLYDHPDVSRVAVIGVPDDEWGERVHAIVVPASGADLTEEDVTEFARERMAGYKIPRSVEFRTDLPDTATGKVQKYELRQEYWKEQDRQIGGG
jgi:fatty-acyl-CoA synthase